MALFAIHLEAHLAGIKAGFGDDFRVRAFLPRQNGAGGGDLALLQQPRGGIFLRWKKIIFFSGQLRGYPLREAKSAPDTFDNSQSVPSGRTIVEIVK